MGAIPTSGTKDMMNFFDETKIRDPREFEDVIFVFGSNLAGRHGAGAAWFAQRAYGAKYGVGIGRSGQSYAIPTKDALLNTLSLEDIHLRVKEFLKHALYCKDEKFFVTRIGCGLAGYTNEQIAPMFRGAPDNCMFEQSWKEYLI